MSEQNDNKATVGRWFTEFWGETYNPAVVDELAAPDMLLHYSLHDPRRGREDIKAFMKEFREAFPDLAFEGAADLIAEGDFVVGRWIGGGTHSVLLGCRQRIWGCVAMIAIRPHGNGYCCKLDLG